MAAAALAPWRRGRTQRTSVLLAATTNLGHYDDIGGHRLLNEAPIGHVVGAPRLPHPRHAKFLDLLPLHASVALGSSARSSSASSTATSLTHPRPCPHSLPLPPHIHSASLLPPCLPLLRTATARLRHAQGQPWAGEAVTTCPRSVDDGNCEATTRPRTTSGGRGSHDSPEAKNGWETQSRLARGHQRAGDAVTTRSRPTLGERHSHDL
jgi:hypothetical protein